MWLNEEWVLSESYGEENTAGMGVDFLLAKPENGMGYAAAYFCQVTEISDEFKLRAYEVGNNFSNLDHEEYSPEWYESADVDLRVGRDELTAQNSDLLTVGDYAERILEELEG